MLIRMVEMELMRVWVQCMLTKTPTGCRFAFFHAERKIKVCTIEQLP